MLLNEKNKSLTGVNNYRPVNIIPLFGKSI